MLEKVKNILNLIYTEIKSIPNDIKIIKNRSKELLDEIKNEGKKDFQQLKKDKKWWKQIPNALTASRAIAPVVTLIQLLLGVNPLTILITITTFALTDLADGKVAALLKSKSKLGCALDQFCDKIMAIGLSIIFAPFNLIIILNLLGELIIGKIAIKASNDNGLNKSDNVGRIKTWFLFASIIGSFASFGNLIPKELFYTLFASSIVLQGATAYVYSKSTKKTDEETSIKYVNNIDLVDEDSKELSYTKTSEVTYNEIPEITTKHVKKLGTK